MATIIKICGITRPEDGVAAIHAGADWLGFIRWPQSARYRPIDECAATLSEIRNSAPRNFQAVAVYVDETKATIRAEAEQAGFDRVQLHGAESMEFAQNLGLPVIKTIKIRDAASVAQADQFPGLTLLTDTADPALPGGTGKTYDPTLLQDLAGHREVIVAGGLTAENVAGVVEFLHPYGVDVSSGVETEPGIKDHEKIAAFVRSVRAVAPDG